jgi:hypothetical protein
MRQINENYPHKIYTFNLKDNTWEDDILKNI